MKQGKHTTALREGLMKSRKKCIIMPRQVVFKNRIKNKPKDRNKKYKTIFYP